MKKILTIALTFLSAFSFAQNTEFFTPVKPNNLRLPSVPIIANDPYFCIWSSFDHLYDGVTSYFSGARKPITGVLRVDGECYRFMGVSYSTVLPLATEENWTAKYVKTTPSGNWYEANYDDSSWTTGKGAFGGGDGSYGNIGTSWSGGNVDVYVRRTFTLDKVDANGEYYFIYKHDDVCEFYLNGEKIASHGNEWNTSGVTLAIPASKLKKGENIIAAHCHNTTGGAYLDFGLYQNTMQTAKQNSCDVLATNTYYNFTCGPVTLDLVFTSPQIIDDLMIQSYPGSFISYQVKSNDGNTHDVQILLGTSAEVAVSSSGQSTISSRVKSGTFVYTKGGTTEQNVLHETGDGQINWGYLYFYSDYIDGVKDITLGDAPAMMTQFQESGTAPATKSSVTQNGGTYPAMNCIHNLGSVGNEAVSSHVMLAYDDVYSINYLGSKRKAYWIANSNRTTFLSHTKSTFNDYENLMQRCRDLDERIYNDGFTSGGEKYAELLSGTYRETMAAHKLVDDNDGNLLWMSRENNSGGFINTVDITYPSAPLFLVYNPELCRGMITPQFEYAYTGKWTKGFAAHDLGPYPMATGQTYGGDMPLEESADMIILAALLQKLTGNTDYTEKYWNLLTTWTDYLVENGKDPTNQLCTDDFMGPSERNTNLALKSIMGIYSYIELCKMLGKEDVAAEYIEKAEPLIAFWKNNAITKTNPKHTRLAFGSNNSTWSEKYNMVWDMMWGWDIFTEAREKDMAFYQSKMLKYGLPLDSRGEYNKNDWHMWVAAMSADDDEFQTYMTPMWNYANETTTRVPLSDYHDANTGTRRGYMARPVVAGYWMKVFMDKFRKQEATMIEKTETHCCQNANEECIYDIAGQKLCQAQKGVNIINGKKVLK